MLAFGLAEFSLAETVGVPRAALATTLVCLASFTIEWVGVHHGFLFGEYTYSANLGPRVGGVPVAIACAWMSLIVIGWGFTPSSFSIIGGWTVSAVLTTSLDLLIDPVASGPLHDWTWIHPGGFYGVPWRNFLVWLLATLLLQFPMSYLGRPAIPPTILWLLFTTLAGMFGLIGVIHHLWIPPLLGTVPVVLAGMAARFTKFRPSETPGTSIRV